MTLHIEVENGSLFGIEILMYLLRKKVIAQNDILWVKKISLSHIITVIFFGSYSLVHNWYIIMLHIYILTYYLFMNATPVPY